MRDCSYSSPKRSNQGRSSWECPDTLPPDHSIGGGGKQASKCRISASIAGSASGPILQPFKQPKDWSKDSPTGKDLQKCSTFLEQSSFGLEQSCGDFGMLGRCVHQDKPSQVSWHCHRTGHLGTSDHSLRIKTRVGRRRLSKQKVGR